MYPQIAQIMLVISGFFLILCPVAQKVSSKDITKIVTVLTVLGYISLIIGFVDLVAFVVSIL